MASAAATAALADRRSRPIVAAHEAIRHRASRRVVSIRTSHGYRRDGHHRSTFAEGTFDSGARMTYQTIEPFRPVWRGIILCL